MNDLVIDPLVVALAEHVLPMPKLELGSAPDHSAEAWSLRMEYRAELKRREVKVLLLAQRIHAVIKQTES